MSHGDKTVVVLCSGFGLGFYIPGVVISEGLRLRGIPTEIEVFENVLPPEKLAMVERNRRAYRASFRVALASQKVPHDIRDSLDPRRADELLSRWLHEGRRHFVCLSGHWIPVLDAYRERLVNAAIHVDLLYVDADLSPSWRHIDKLRPDYAVPYRPVRLYDAARRDVNLYIKVGDSPPVAYAERGRRLVVHGGGWGIGTFQESAPTLSRAGFDLDVVCYGGAERQPGYRCLMDDPMWRCWQRDARGEHTFPPFGLMTEDDRPVVFNSQSGQHGLYDVMRSAAAIVSKPGAGTLMDSFSSATPLVMLEPFGLNEDRNTEVWDSCGFGITFAAWARTGFSMAVLEELHQNLLRKRDAVREYIPEYASYVTSSLTECAA